MAFLVLGRGFRTGFFSRWQGAALTEVQFTERENLVADNFAHFEDGQEHGNNHTANDQAQKDHQQGLD